MKIYVPEKHAEQLTGIIAGVCEKYQGLDREAVTLANFERELVSEVYKYLYLNDAMKYFRSLKPSLKEVSKLLDPYRPAEPLEVIAAPATVKGIFV